MLIGQQEGKVAEKNQVAFPKKFRELLGKRLVITKGFEQCLLVVSVERWETLLEGTIDRPFINKKIRKLQRFLLGNATDVELDSKGRFIIPEYLRDYAGIKTEVVFVGIERYVEVWDKKRWLRHQDELESEVESIAQKLSGEDKDPKMQDE